MLDPESRKELMRLLADFGTIGMTVAFSIFIGVWIGYFIDHKVFGGRTTPGFTLFFLLVGIIAAFRNLWLFIRRSTREDKKDKKDGQ